MMSELGSVNFDTSAFRARARECACVRARVCVLLLLESVYMTGRKILILELFSKVSAFLKQW